MNASPKTGLQGKVAFVTGAAGGIGRAVAQRLAADGARVVAADINEDGLAETCALIGEAARSLTYDAADASSCEKAVNAAAEDGLDIVCNIAGVMDWGETADFDCSRFDRVLAINLVGTFAVCRAALPYLEKSKGVIVNTASTAAQVGIPYAAAYTASKHGVAGLTKSLSVEWASKGVRVNAICPGHVLTAMGTQPPPEGDIDLQLVMRNIPKLADGSLSPDEVASAFSWMVSKDARKMTGSLIVFDGGQTAG
ncbi:MAG: SDR family NAD(P)-dependent oxidoreductase [Pseudomonadota bacterium]